MMPAMMSFGECPRVLTINNFAFKTHDQ